MPTLAQNHRKSQVELRRRFTVAFIEALHELLNVWRLDASTPVWLATAEHLVTSYRQAAARLAGDYYGDQRRAGTGRNERHSPTLSGEPDRARLRAGLLVTGPIGIKRGTAAGRDIGDLLTIAETRCEAAAWRHVADGARETIRRTAATDPLATGWARITGPSPCWLCAMQASRGPIFLNRQTAGDRYHDGCNCHAKPVFTRGPAAWPAESRRWRQRWDAATAGQAGREARLAFRRSLNESS